MPSPPFACHRHCPAWTLSAAVLLISLCFCCAYPSFDKHDANEYIVPSTFNCGTEDVWPLHFEPTIDHSNPDALVVVGEESAPISLDLESSDDIESESTYCWMMRGSYVGLYIITRDKIEFVRLLSEYFLLSEHIFLMKGESDSTFEHRSQDPFMSQPYLQHSMDGLDWQFHLLHTDERVGAADGADNIGHLDINEWHGIGGLSPNRLPPSPVPTATHPPSRSYVDVLQFDRLNDEAERLLVGKGLIYELEDEAGETDDPGHDFLHHFAQRNHFPPQAPPDHRPGSDAPLLPLPDDSGSSISNLINTESVSPRRQYQHRPSPRLPRFLPQNVLISQFNPWAQNQLAEPAPQVTPQVDAEQLLQLDAAGGAYHDALRDLGYRQGYDPNALHQRVERRMRNASGEDGHGGRNFQWDWQANRPRFHNEWHFDRILRVTRTLPPRHFSNDRRITPLPSPFQSNFSFRYRRNPMTGEFEEYNYDYVTGEFVRKVDGVLWNEIFANASVHSSNENRGGGRGSADVSAVTESKFSFRWRVNPSTGILEEYEPHQFLEGEYFRTIDGALWRDLWAVHRNEFGCGKDKATEQILVKWRGKGVINIVVCFYSFVLPVLF